MIKLIKVHYNYLFSYRMLYILLSLGAIFLIVCLYFSRFYIDNELLMFDANFYQNEYMFEAFNIAKILIVLFAFLQTVYAYVLNKYDYFLVVRASRKKVFLSKVIVLYFIATIFITICYLILFIIPLYLTPYFSTSTVSIGILLKMLLFGYVYNTLFIMTITITKHVFGLFLVFTGFIISFISNDLEPIKENVTNFNKVSNIIFPDIIQYTNVGYDFLYGSIFVIALTLLYVSVGILVYQYTDI